jgi:hypothetical protein
MVGGRTPDGRGCAANAARGGGDLRRIRRCGAPTPADKCVSVFAGTFGLAGNAAGGVGGAALGGVIPVPGAAPVLAIGGGYAAGEWMKSIGTKVGTVLCGA